MMCVASSWLFIGCTNVFWDYDKTVFSNSITRRFTVMTTLKDFVRDESVNQDLTEDQMQCLFLAPIAIATMYQNSIVTPSMPCMDGVTIEFWYMVTIAIGAKNNV